METRVYLSKPSKPIQIDIGFSIHIDEERRRKYTGYNRLYKSRSVISLPNINLHHGSKRNTVSLIMFQDCEKETYYPLSLSL